MVKSVAFLRPILREEAVAQRVVAHNVLDLQGSREGAVSPLSDYSQAHPLTHHTSNLISHTPGPVRGPGGLEIEQTQVWSLEGPGGGANGDFKVPCSWSCY